MANNSFLFLFAIFFIGFFIQGNCQSVGANFTITQKATGRLIKNKTEWKVTVTNDYFCPQYNIQLDCGRFQTTLPIPKVLNLNDGICEYQGSDPPYSPGYLDPSQSFTFYYAWIPQYHFKVVQAFIGCD
ncbi:Beta-1 3-N-Acetylglucosaminyltransferase family protein [Euphorbia peplus]|nr:Beta-1 3-N-Acetylglucosaminyltransferase family protein [Euphorbia peplus]